MTDSISKARPGIIAMRWIARLVSIPWAYLALGSVWFVSGVGIEEGKLSEMTADAIIFTAFLLTLGPAIIAGVWGKEVAGGWMLLADVVLIFIWGIVAPQADVLVAIMLPPPLLAGALFLACHALSKQPESKPA